MTNRPKINSYYYHYKHDPSIDLLNYCYQIIGIAKHSETDELLVTYRHLYQSEWHEVDGANLTVRPLDMFMETVEWQGETVPRFRELNESEVVKIKQDIGFIHLFYNDESEVLNNFSPHPVNIFGREFTTAEHAYQYAKYMDTEPEIASQIAKAKTPMEAKHIANHPNSKPKRNPNWTSEKVGIMKQVLITKMEQNQEVNKFLINSRRSQLAEDSPTDMFWGVKGENMLGKLWMEIRQNLIK